MVDQAADGCVYIAGGHRAHQIKADIYQFYAVRVYAGVLHDAVDQGLRKLRTGITDRLALQILRRGDIFILERKNDIQRALHNRTDRLDRHVLLSARLDDILLIVQANISLACCDHTHRIVNTGRRLNINIQTLLSKVSLLLCFIQKCVQSIRIPVEHNRQMVQIILRAAVSACFGIAVCSALCAAAGQQHCACCQKCKNSLFHK